MSAAPSPAESPVGHPPAASPVGHPPAASPAASPAADFSLALLGEFVALGVTDAVLTPGSRSQALALVLAELHRARMLDLQVRIDERVAGFTAVGLAAETFRPAIVVTTSGTAVANLMPAVLEAHHSRVPMLLVTSDRPASMRGTAGNQTTWQDDLFGRFVRLALDVPPPVGDPGEPALAARLARDAVEAALGTHTGDPGPVHLNLQLREPLSGAVPDLVALLAAGEWMPGVAAPAAPPSLAHAAASALIDAAQPAPAAQPAAATPPLLLPLGPRTLVVAGHDAGPAAEELAHRGGWPLVAEPSSGSRFGRNLIVAYRELLNDPGFGGRVQRVVVFGHPTLSREVPALSLRDDVETIVVTPAASARPGEEVVDVYNPGHRVRTFVTAATVEGAPDDRDWLRTWVLASRAIVEAQGADDPIPAPNIELANSPDIAERRAYRLAETAALKAPVTRRALALAVWQATWPHDRLVLGASRLIRDLDRAAPGKNIRVHANRGLAGIDGTVSTATGIALASQRAPLERARVAAPVAGEAASAAQDEAVRTAAAGVAARPWAVQAVQDAAAQAAVASLARAAGVELAARPGAVQDAAAQAAGRVSGAGSTRRGGAAAQHGVTRVLLGDLTLLHDAGALLFGTGEARPRIQLIVANDGGGTIFDTLEVADTADAAAFDRVMLTPQTVDLEALARAYGWAYTRATTRVELDRELTAPLTGPTLLEVPLPR